MNSISDDQNWTELNFQNLSNIECSDSDVKLIQSLSNDAVYVGRKLQTSVSVPGNIHKLQFRDFWMNQLSCSDLVKRTIVEGYELPFLEVPPPSMERNNASAREDIEFVRAEVKRL